MANTDRPHGFRPIYALGGVHGQTHNYTLAAANTRIAIGDVVVRTNAGLIDRAAAGATQIIGVAAAPAAASSGDVIPVYDNPFQVYEGQTDDGTGVLTAQTGVNLNANLVATANTGDISLMEIDESSGDTTNTLPLRILRLYDVPDNAFGEFNRFEVMINNHVLSGGLGSTGV